MRHARLPLRIATVLVPLAAWVAAQGVPDAAASRVEALLARMTLAEKVGQLTQYPSSHDGLAELARRGELGSVLNVHGAAAVNALQRVAVEESRLGVPLLFGLDVIHGFRTIFPVPLASASSFDLELIERAEAVAAQAARAGMDASAPLSLAGRDGGPTAVAAAQSVLTAHPEIVGEVTF